MGEATRPEELMNSLLKLRMSTRNVANGLGILALLWSTVVLLGGFVGVLRLKEFWVLTAMSFLMACRVLDIFDEELIRGVIIYVEEARIINILVRLGRVKEGVSGCFGIFFSMLLVPKVILFSCPVLFLQFVPYVSLGLSVWRLVQRDYGDAGGDIANRAKLNAALDIFYALVLLLSLFVMYWMLLVVLSEDSVETVASLTNKQWGYDKWISKLVQMYYKETRRKYNKDGELPNKWNLTAYAVRLLQSASASGDDDDHMWGARVLDKLFDSKDISVRQQLLSSKPSIQNLICMIGRRGTADNNIESRERAARIVAHLASDLHITHFPDLLQCICSLLESSNLQFCEPRVTCLSLSSEKKPDEQSRSLETSDHPPDAHTLVPIEDQTDHEQEQVVGSSSSAGLAQKKRTTFLERYKKANERERQHKKDIKEWKRYTYRSRGPKELISQGLLILERLTQDEENCTEISKHQRLLSKITSPLRGHDFLSNPEMLEMLSNSLTVVSRLLTSPGDGAATLRQELASNTEAVSNLMAILETDSEGAQELHEQALEILTELAFDDSFTKPASGESTCMLNKLFKTLQLIFLEEKDGDNAVEEPDREREPPEG